jgi:hypothetical protein
MMVIRVFATNGKYINSITFTKHALQLEIIVVGVMLHA